MAAIAGRPWAVRGLGGLWETRPPASPPPSPVSSSSAIGYG